MNHPILERLGLSTPSPQADSARTDEPPKHNTNGHRENGHPKQSEPSEAALAGITADGPPWPEPMDDAAYHGLAGEIVKAIEPHSEGDPAAVLLQFLACFGNVIGRTGYFRAEADKHFGNLFVCLVGQSSKGRKGSSLGQVLRPFQLLELTPVQEWLERCHQSGLSSAEGLADAVRDPIFKREFDRETNRVQEVQVDAGVEDKRLLVTEPEFASTLRVMGREGNRLSPEIRNAWDTGCLQSMTKNTKTKATNAHISIIGHITAGELRRYLNETEAANGFGNRILWCCAKRSKYLPEGGNLTDNDLIPLAIRTGQAVELAEAVDEIRRDGEARDLWCEIYPKLSDGKPGMFGAVTGRAEAQTMRLACLYALLDQTDVIRLEHLMAALAVWNYCEQSARFVFGESLGDKMADELLIALKSTPDGLTRSEIRELFGRNKSSGEIGRALSLLVEHGLVEAEKEPEGRGRPAERWCYAGTPKTR